MEPQKIAHCSYFNINIIIIVQGVMHNNRRLELEVERSSEAERLERLLEERTSSAHAPPPPLPSTEASPMTAAALDAGLSAARTDLAAEWSTRLEEVRQRK